MRATVSTNSNDSEPEARREELKIPKADVWWPIAAAIVVALAALIRLYRLDLVPLHHDEGVNGYFLTRLLHEGVYRYDPANYHGPTLYYLSLPFAYLLGLNTFAIRCVTVVFGIGIVWLVLELRRELGRTAVLAAAVLIAISPGAVYFSRYFIHETLFVFLTMAIFVAGLRHWQTRSGSSLFLSAGCVGLLVATKETAIITLAVFGIALAITWFWIWFVRRRRSKEHPPPYVDAETDVSESSEPAVVQIGDAIVNPEGIDLPIVSAVGSGAESQLRKRRNATAWVGAVSLTAVLFVCLYSSFFTNPHGILDGLRALVFWARTAESQHAHPWNTYLKWLWQMEGPLSVLAAAGAVVAIWRKDSVSFFVFLWAVGILSAYSLVPYKTPWLSLNFIPPFALLAGIALEASLKAAKNTWPVVAVVLGAAVCVSGFKSVKLNFYGYDDDRYPYVYAHTRREFLDLVSEIYDLAGRSGRGSDISIAVVSPDYWPLPWYLRDYTHVSYFGKTSNTDADLIIGPAFPDEELRAILENSYKSIGVYTLRPGVDLTLYVRTDLPVSQ